MTATAAVGVALVGLGATHLVYTYVAYPWIVGLLPVRPPRPATAPDPRLVSIVIAARGAGREVPEKVRHRLQTVWLDCGHGVVLHGTGLRATSRRTALPARRPPLV